MKKGEEVEEGRMVREVFMPAGGRRGLGGMDVIVAAPDVGEVDKGWMGEVCR
jgi:hypothetical protein